MADLTIIPSIHSHFASSVCCSSSRDTQNASFCSCCCLPEERCLPSPTLPDFPNLHHTIHSLLPLNSTLQALLKLQAPNSTRVRFAFSLITTIPYSLNDPSPIVTLWREEHSSTTNALVSPSPQMLFGPTTILSNKINPVTSNRWTLL